MKSRVLFIHRSVGHNLLVDGNVYELLKAQKSDIALSDYDQNTDTLTDDTGVQQHPGFVFPGGNTRPEDYAQIFCQEPGSYKPILDLALTYDTVVIKSCYPNSTIKTDKELEQIKGYYTSIMKFFADAHPKKQLVIVTSPPLRPLMTQKTTAHRARELADWLSRSTPASNIKTFNLFDLLTAPEGHRHGSMLRREYRRWLPIDNHPNPRASKNIAPLFVEMLAKV